MKTLMGTRKLYYCDECKHIYYELPPHHECVICNNQMNATDVISDFDVLSCETCHSLYSAQNADQIIPKNIENPNHLCGCKFNWPTNSSLNVGKAQSFLGNIGLTDIYKCSNCNALFYRNIDEKAKNCSECNSRFVHPMNIDNKKQKTFFKCGNTLPWPDGVV